MFRSFSLFSISFLFFAQAYASNGLPQDSEATTTNGIKLPGQAPVVTKMTQARPKLSLPAKPEARQQKDPILSDRDMMTFVQLLPQYLPVLLPEITSEMSIEDKVKFVSTSLLENLKTIRFLRAKLFETLLRLSSNQDSTQLFQNAAEAQGFRLLIFGNVSLENPRERLMATKFSESSNGDSYLSFCKEIPNGLDRLIRARDCAYRDRFFYEALWKLMENNHLDWKNFCSQGNIAKAQTETEKDFLYASHMFWSMLFPYFKSKLEPLNRPESVFNMEQYLSRKTYLFDCEGLDYCQGEEVALEAMKVQVTQLKQLMTIAMIRLTSSTAPVIFDGSLEKHFYRLKTHGKDTLLALTPDEQLQLKKEMNLETVKAQIQFRTEAQELFDWYEAQHQQYELRLKSTEELLEQDGKLVTKLQAREKQLSLELTESVKKNSELNDQVKALKTEARKTKKSNKTLQAELQHQASEVKRLELENTVLQAATREKEEANKEHAHQTSLVLQEREELRQRSVELQEENRRLNEKLKETQQQLEASQAQVRETHEHNVELSHQVSMAQYSQQLAQQQVMWCASVNNALLAQLQQNLQKIYGFRDGRGVIWYLTKEQILWVMADAMSDYVGPEFTDKSRTIDDKI